MNKTRVWIKTIYCCYLLIFFHIDFVVQSIEVLRSMTPFLYVLYSFLGLLLLGLIIAGVWMAKKNKQKPPVYLATGPGLKNLRLEAVQGKNIILRNTGNQYLSSVIYIMDDGDLRNQTEIENFPILLKHKVSVPSGAKEEIANTTKLSKTIAGHRVVQEMEPSGRFVDIIGIVDGHHNNV